MSETASDCYGTALIFHFFSLFGLVDIIIRFKGEHMVNTWFPHV